MANIKFEDLMLLIPVYAKVVMFALKGDLILEKPFLIVQMVTFNPTVALATVIGPLIEVPVMLVLVWFAKKQNLDSLKGGPKHVQKDTLSN